MAEPRALLLSPESPYPTHGGGALRTASIHEYLRRHYTVDLVVFATPGDPEPPFAFAVIGMPSHSRSPGVRAARNLVRFLRGTPPLMDRFAGFQGQLSRAIGDSQYDVAILEHFWTAPYLDTVASHCNRILLDLHNIESVWLERVANTAPRGLKLPFSRWAANCRRLERELLPRFERILVASEEDAETVRSLAPGARTLVYPNAIPQVPEPVSERRNAIVFSGNLEYQPNRQAVQFFARRIWPILATEFPDLEWHLIGRNPRGVQDFVFSSPRVRVIGPIEDAVLELSRYRVAVVPVLSGSGTRLKIIEAWAAGVPVVSTPLGAEGLAASPGCHLLTASDPDAFARAVSRLLRDPSLSQSVAAAGRRLYEERFSWDVAWNTFIGNGI
jgi:polysaccharide biosynthesis protein PslH